jgi:two-component system, sensor histidine kinase and response regulator
MEGFGLQGMQERMTVLAGYFRLITEPDKGCQIQVEIPLSKMQHDSLITG